MSFKPAIIFILFLAFIIPVSAQQTPPSSSQAVGSQAGMANAAESAQLKRMSGNDAQSMQDDIRKMRAIVAQMESNLAFVDNTQSPLKHQFQLEIDMWKALLNQMERRANAR
jgi:TolA-binding protein